MYNCRVVKRVWRDTLETQGFVQLYYDVESETAPEIGQQLQQLRWYSGPLTGVVWNVDEERFTCSVADEHPSTDDDYDYTYEFIVENALHEGWKLAEI